MFKGFKNSEYLKYVIDDKLDKEKKNHQKDSSKQLSQILSAVFSATMGSSFVTLLNNDILPIANTLVKFLVSFLIAILSVVILFVVFYYIVLSIQKIILLLTIRRNAENSYKLLIAYFDNIVCDSVMLTQNYIEALNVSGLTQAIHVYSLFEGFHYLRKALDGVRVVILNQNQLISNNVETDRISAFRVNNLITILKQQIVDIDAILNNAKIKVDNEALDVFATIKREISVLSPV